MMSKGQNRAAAIDIVQVDRLNAKFYDAIRYPGPVHVLREFTPSNFWLRMLSQDIGNWTGDAILARPKIWIAGCGRNQALITALRFPDAEVVGSDIASESLAVCRNNADAVDVRNLELRKESLNEVNYSNAFDYVICSGVIHHNADPRVPLAALSRALKPHGILELMVYNEYHRLHTAAFQQATRRIIGNLSSPDLDAELVIAKKLARSFNAPSLMNQFLAPYREDDCRDAYFCDALLQPVEQSYTVETLSRLLSSCDLELLQFCIDQFSMAKDAVNWNLDPTDAEVRKMYFNLPDVERWQIANLMLQEASPMLWFYIQRRDSGRQRKTERQLCEEFLERRFVRTKATMVAHTLQPDGSYKRSQKVVPYPGKPQCAHAAQVYQVCDESLPIADTIRRLGFNTSFSSVHSLRINLTTSAYPFLQALA